MLHPPDMHDGQAVVTLRSGLGMKVVEATTVNVDRVGRPRISLHSGRFGRRITGNNSPMFSEHGYGRMQGSKAYMLWIEKLLGPMDIHQGALG